MFNISIAFKFFASYKISEMKMFGDTCHVCDFMEAEQMWGAKGWESQWE